MFRLSARALVELTLTVILGLAGLLMLVSTWSKFKAARAFGKAMDNYAIPDLAGAHEALQAAIDARPAYMAPQEALGKLMVDDAERLPASEAVEKFAAARKFFEGLKGDEEAAESRASPAVLVGLAVADLEATRAKGPPKDELRQAVAQARTRLEEALTLHPSGATGDLYVNLATVALLDDDVAGAEKYLEKVRETGDLSSDALRYVYNLKGLLALRKGLLAPRKGQPKDSGRPADDPAKLFEIVHDFDPEWEVPRLNLAAAQAQSLLRDDLETVVSEHLAGRVLASVEIAKKYPRAQLVGPLYNTLAIHSMRMGRADMASDFLKQSEALAPLSWHARFNQNVARYLQVWKDRVNPTERTKVIADLRREFDSALRSPNATLRDTFTTQCLLATLDAMTDRLPGATSRFEGALKTTAPPGERFVRSALPRVHRALASLYYKDNQYKKALDELDKSATVPDQMEFATALRRQLRTPPAIEGFSAEPAKIVTDFDVRIRARILAPSVPKPLAPENIRLTLTNTLAGTTTPIPFHLLGSQLRAVVLNLPQGRFRVQLQVTDHLGNPAQATSKDFEFDREPPRIRGHVPAPGAVVKSLDSIQFRVDDVLGHPDLTTLNVLLQYPKGATTPTAPLVSRGKYLIADGQAQGSADVTEDVKSPLRRPTPRGKYTVTVRVQDDKGKRCEAEWSFTLE